MDVEEGVDCAYESELIDGTVRVDIVDIEASELSQG